MKALENAQGEAEEQYYSPVANLERKASFFSASFTYSTVKRPAVQVSRVTILFL
jgi:hypothetical protein